MIRNEKCPLDQQNGALSEILTSENIEIEKNEF